MGRTGGVCALEWSQRTVFQPRIRLRQRLCCHCKTQLRESVNFSWFVSGNFDILDMLPLLLNYAQSKTSDSDFRLESESREYTCTPAVCLQTNSTYSREYVLFPARLLFSISFYF